MDHSDPGQRITLQGRDPSTIASFATKSTAVYKPLDRAIDLAWRSSYQYTSTSTSRTAPVPSPFRDTIVVTQ
jgi:hypothetical protein